MDVCYRSPGLEYEWIDDVLTWVFGIVVAVYAVLFMDWDTKDTPFDGVSRLMSLIGGCALWAHYVGRFVRVSFLVFGRCFLHLRRLVLLGGRMRRVDRDLGGIRSKVLTWRWCEWPNYMASV